MKLVELCRLIDSTVEWIEKPLSILLYCMMGILIVEVFARYFLNSPTKWAADLSLTCYGIIGALAGAYTLRYKSHVNVDIFYAKVSERSKAIMNLITSIFFIFFCIVILWKGSLMALESLRMDERLPSVWGFPVYPIRLALPVGAFLLLVQGLAHYIRDIIFLVSGEDTKS